MVENGFKSSFMREAAARGFIFQCTDADALDALMAEKSVAAYIGFDPTADSLHVGSLIQIMMLRLLQKHGHRPIALVGGGTARIGDPSFREEARRLMTEDIIQTNLAGIEGCLRQFLTFGSGASEAALVNNADWLDKLAYIDLLRDVGVHFSINRMLAFDSVKNRLEREQGLTFLEFNYSILQSYDFRELNRRMNVVLQLGGSDQWGNIISGVELVRRTDQKSVMGLTTPLLTTSSGAKMGKTANGAVWLSEKRLPVFDYWQFWRNTEDADVGRFLRLFTELPLEECARLEALQGAEINEAKKVLATEATALCHGRNAALAAAEAARQTFEEGRVAAADLPVHEVAEADMAAGIPVFRLFAEAGLVKTNGEARRLVRGGGARLNNDVIQDENKLITQQDMVDGAIKLSAGKKHHVLVKVGVSA
ncbi:tyrosine--tRNA ligase [Acetobacter pasteurianus]|uniref:Tyrosine--tRNA ligase n=3 Tax=Acetobacter pasteurianus TaxID=438 RepID=A0A401WWX8_ACEPA|nr:tyrosine--tRNA ligase [Acetobacter pasteurianus]BAU39653.1 tyrosyl-tRNA synthetase [Acetobacter pasteurianus NBRC 101655]ASC05742.1 Tyrosine--tRNA ligase [Acetobacter pasteurianus subsp. pasteurianus]RCL08000.1 tyrosine--tRNA ligase [Acetobacter pasteurianus]CCT59477.1 tyrosyl-tRNA synthetase [Acetobacter pasteurianus 386B]BAI00684.1 tyrosyl-tRNA synthetase [Acetobacter pasteurianus IFO 3283-01]